MADSTIAALPLAGSINLTDSLPLDQSGSTKRTTISALSTYVATANLAWSAPGAIGSVTPNTGNFINVTLNAPISGSSTTGALSYGVQSYSDTGNFATFSAALNGYAQFGIQNTSTGTLASSDFIVANNLSTAGTYYGDFGINGSGFTGSGSFNLPNATFLTATTGDLALGTTTSNAVHFVINSGTTDAGTINTSGNWVVTSLLANTGALGYGTGVGGTVSQSGTRITAVTLNKLSGQITMVSAAGSATAATFTVNNTTVAATDTIILNQKSGTNLYVFLVTAVAANSFNITFYTTGGTSIDIPVINFNVIKGVTA